ncbi:MAG TPA: ABC transporter permease, partial [Thermomicrobiales bacterium]|nr:ABC transporter permease [Thermomicrobiales bacterium]
AAQPDVVSPVILSDTTNARLAGSSPVDFVAVTAKEPSSNMSAVARVRAALRGSTATVIPPERAALSMSGDTVAARRNLIDLSGTFAGLALLVGLFVAVTTLALSAAQSARDIALLRAIGATPRQARRLLAAQSILLAGVSGVLGCLVGPWLAGTALASLIAHGVTPRFVMVQFSWIPLVSTIGGVGLVAWLATVLAARKATRIRPVEALRDSTAEPVGGIGRWRVVLGAFVLVGSVIVSGIHMPGGGGTNQAATASLVVLVLMAAIGILGPLLAKVGSILMWPVLRVGGRMGLLASANSRMYSRRTASATTATALVVSLAALTVFLPAMVESATDRAVAERERGTVRVTSDLGFAPADVRRARHAQGVEAIVGLAHSVVIHGRVSTIDFKATCVLGDRIDDVLQLGVIRGSIPSSWTRGVVVSRQVAESWNVTPGDKVELLMADGRITEPEVLATFSNALGFADVLMPWSMSTEQHAGIDEVVVRADTRAGTPERLRAALRDPRSIVTSNTGSAAADEDTALNLWLTRRLLGLVCLMAGVALVATLAMVTVSRRGELTALRLLGATHRQLRSMLRAEGLTVWCVGVGQGVLVACVALLPLLHALPGARLATAPVLEMLAVLLALAIACFGTVALSLRVVTRGGAHR